MNAINDSQTAIDSTKSALATVLSAARAALPQVESFDQFVGDRNSALAELSAVRGELAKARETMASVRGEVDYAQTQLQRVKDETSWAVRDLGKLRQELDEIERQKRRRG